MRQVNGELTGRLVLTDQPVFQMLVAILDEYRTDQTGLDNLHGQVSDHLKQFGCNNLDTYFNEAMADAKSDQELYWLSDAYEIILLVELKRIKKKLHVLRTT